MSADRRNHGLRGEVRSIRVDVMRYVDEDGHVVERPWFSRETVFDRAGNTLEDTFTASRGIHRTINDYDAGRLLATRVYDGTGSILDEKLHAYDGEGRRVSEQHSAAGGVPLSSTSYSYDSRGRKTKTLVHARPVGGAAFMTLEGTRTGICVDTVKRIETRYNERDEAVEVTLHDGQGELVRRVEIERDVHGRVLKVTQFRGAARPFAPRIYDAFADAGERFTAEQRAEFEAEMNRRFGPGTTASEQTNTYDDERRRAESEGRIMGAVAYRRASTYEERGDGTEEAISGGTREEEIGGATFRREYDAHGNWTQEVVLADSGSTAGDGSATPQHVTRRTITYY